MIGERKLLSRLESRWFQYLTASKLSRQNVEREREKFLLILFR